MRFLLSCWYLCLFLPHLVVRAAQHAMVCSSQHAPNMCESVLRICCKMQQLEELLFVSGALITENEVRSDCSTA